MNREYKAYRKAYYILRVAFSIFYRVKAIGLENIPAGGAIVCANHTSSMDPLFMIVAMLKKPHLRFMAKAELFSSKIFGTILKKIGSFAVNRSGADISAIRTAMRFLKNGEKVVIFPEGTRVSDDDAVVAKNGAVKLSAKVNVPILPVYVPRKKTFFKRNIIIIGEPYYISGGEEKLTNDDYALAAEQLMVKIRSLSPEV